VLDAQERELVRKILSGIARAGERYGRRRIAAMLHGDLDGLPSALTGLSTTGLLRNDRVETIGQWIEAAISGGLIKVSTDKYRTLGLTPLGRDVMAGRVEEVRMESPARPRPRQRKHGDAGRLWGDRRRRRRDRWLDDWGDS
jgi:superfamily II DNA helicase RecQ